MRARGKNAERPDVYFVCYGGPRIGLGHVSRCVHLARALKARGVTTHLFVNPDRRITGMVRRGGLSYSTAPVGRLPALPVGTGRAVCILDYNNFGRSFLQGMRGRATVVNLAPQKLPKWYADININATAVNDGRRPPDANTGALNLRGPRYAVVSERFRAVRQRRIRRKVGTALICLGGGSYVTAAGKIIRAFELVHHRLRLVVVLGRAVGDIGAVREYAKRSRHDVGICRDITDIELKMQSADLAITFPGVTAYECLCVGLPTLLIAPTPFHMKIIRELRQLRCAVNAGHLSRLVPRKLGRRIAALTSDPAERAALHGHAKRAVDGKGLDRAAAAVMKAMNHG